MTFEEFKALNKNGELKKALGGLTIALMTAWTRFVNEKKSLRTGTRIPVTRA